MLDLRPPLISAVAALDGSAVDAVISEALEGSSTADIIDQLIQPTMVWIGDQWQSGAWTVAREHSATDILSKVIADLPYLRRFERGETVIVACADGEWHTVACLMVGHVLRSEGFDVIQLDGPITAGQLLPLLHEHGPRCVTISCVMPANLAGVRRLATVARDAGIPAIAGGRALTESRAKHVGANAYARTVGMVAAAIDSTHRIAAPMGRLQHNRAAGFEWIDLHLTELAAAVAGMTDSDEGEVAVQAVWALRALKAALLCDDPEVFGQHVEWLRSRQRVGGPDAASLIEIVRTATSSGPAAIGEVVEAAVTG